MKKYFKKVPMLLKISLILVLVIAAGVFIYQKYKIAQETAGWLIYTNNQYGFSFKYPKEWESSKIEDANPGTTSPIDKHLVFQVFFEDPIMKLKVDCNTNEEDGWLDSNFPSKDTCTPALDGFSVEQKDELNWPGIVDDLYLHVYKKDASIDLKSWLNSTFNQPNSELEGYTVGNPIELAGEKGYFSDTGCCGGADRSSVVSKDGYVYVFGTTYKYSSADEYIMPEVFQKAAKTFRIK